MDMNSSIQELTGNQVCEARCSGNQLKLAGFDDDSEWSDDSPSADAASIISAAAGTDLNRCTSMAEATEMEVVSPLVRSIFEGRKKEVLDAGQKAISKKNLAAGGAQLLAQQVPQKDTGHFGELKKTPLHKKVEALNEEIAIFKKETKRMRDLQKEHEEGLTKMARERAEWEQQNKCQMLALQAKQEEQVEELKKEKKLMDQRAIKLKIMPGVQRKDLEELKATFVKEQEEHRGKEMRLRLTVDINRLKAMNEDLTKQVLELQDEIRRYECCVLSALDNRGNGLQVTSLPKKLFSEANHKRSCFPPKQLPPEALRGGGSHKSNRQCPPEGNCDPLRGRGNHKSSRQCPPEENCDFGSVSIDEEPDRCRTEHPPNFFSEQAKLLSDLFSRPWKLTNCAPKQSTQINRHQMDLRFADWTSHMP